MARLPQTGVLATNTASAMELIEAGKATTGWARPWIGDLSYDYAAPRYSNSWAEALADYESQQPLIRELHCLIEQPLIDHHLAYGQGFNLILPHLAPTKKCAQRLGAAALCELRKGDSTEAVAHVRTMVALTHATRMEQLLISQLVRCAVASIAMSVTWDLLQAGNLEDADLETLQTEWSKLDFLSPMESALVMERALSLLTIQQMRNSPASFQNITMLSSRAGAGGAVQTNRSFAEWVEDTGKTGLERTKVGLARSAWTFSWSYTDELKMLKGNQSLVEVVRLAIDDGFASNALTLQEEMIASGDIPQDSGSTFWLSPGAMAGLATLFSDGVASALKALEKALIAQAGARMTTAAIALERHRLRYGVYPEQLDELAPEIIAATPMDPIDGKPLRYQRRNDGSYLLYSIALNMKDDGGDVRREDTNKYTLYWGWGRDWVWPQHASEAEVLSYWRDELAKKYAEASHTVDLSTQWTEQYFDVLRSHASE